MSNTLTPSPAQIREAREAAGLTQTQAAALVHCTLRAWQLWEAAEKATNRRGMHPAIWELFRLKTCGRPLPRI